MTLFECDLSSHAPFVEILVLGTRLCPRPVVCHKTQLCRDGNID